MDLHEAIDRRRTIRKFNGMATEEQLKRILAQGTKAPSGRNQQNWEFILVEDTGLIEKISDIKYILNRGKPQGEPVSEELEKAAQSQKDSFANASLVLVYHGQGPTSAAGGWCCIQNMLLTAVAEGLGTKITYFGGVATQEINQLVQAPDEMVLAAAISIGIPAAEPGPRQLRPEGSWLHRDRF